ncbi:MAG: ATPase, T2SS/T4P/T4SS family [Candidatus Omnitrophota bacterium]
MSRYSDFKTDSEFCKLCLQEKQVSSDTLNRAIPKFKASEKSLLDILVTEFGVDVQGLYRVLSSRMGYTTLDLESAPIESAAIEKVPIKIASHYGFMPVRFEASSLVIAVDYPFNLKTIDEIRLQLGVTIAQVLSPKAQIVQAIKRYYGFAANTVDRIVSAMEPIELIESGNIPIEQIDKLASDASVINLVNEILFDAFGKRSTDVHFEPYRGDFRLRYRVDGVLYDINLSQKARQLIQPILSRIKIMANLNIVERRLPQDGRAIVKVKNENLDLRISSIPTPHGESIVIRILPTQMIFDLKKLGLSQKNVTLLEGLIRKPHGIILLTGPTGSGKTTTLYACLNRLNSNMIKIITIEDPVEYEIQGITQIQVMPKVGLDFAKGLRSMLRHDPDIMMVGEIRDYETAEIAIRAALTGHLVFSTLHTNDAASGFTRLLDIGVEPFLVASSVEAIIAQRLVRTICQKCRCEDSGLKPEFRKRIASELGIRESEVKAFRGAGCETCNKTGYFGRTALHELLLNDERIRELVGQKACSNEIKAHAVSRGMETLVSDGWRKVLEGITTIGEVINVTDVLQEPLAAKPLAPTAGDAAVVAPMRPGSGETAVAVDRRAYLRTSASVEVFYKEVELHYRLWDMAGRRPSEEGPEKSAVTENLSASGILMRSRELVELGTALELRFIITHKDYSREIRCLGRSVRSEESLDRGGFILGVMFLDLSTADRVFLDDYVKDISTGEI